MNQRLRIACYGFVEKNSGSVASANFLILEELLKRGWQIDFYSWRVFPKPQDLFQYHNFRYFEIPDKSWLRAFLTRLPRPLSQFLEKTLYPLAHLLFVYDSDNKVMRQEILSNHHSDKYDLLLFLGLYAPFRIEDIPVIAWAQAPPQTEWFFIRKLRNQIMELCGLVLYLKLTIFYFGRSFRARKEVKNSDVLIVGSQWSKEQLVLYGVPGDSIWSLPFPIDIDAFRGDCAISEPKRRDTKVFLWLGRCDPRKKLDLMLQAYRLLLKERQDVRLRIIGKMGYAEGYKKLIEQFEFPDYLDYQPFIERVKVKELMAQCDILIQPSEGENFGSSVAEAMCCGLPVIVGPTNGTKDYISSSSFVFSAYEPESLKKTMVQAIQAVEQDRDGLAIDARKTAEKNFNISRVVNCLEEIFQKALNSRSDKAGGRS
jgi:glycosyltransferase involved in cell wall biosynthesis